MKINPMWKQIITEQFLKTTIRKPSQFNLPPNSIRFALEQMCRLFPMEKSVQVRQLRLAGLHAEELKPQNLDLNSFEDEAPVLPQESEDDDTYDLQKELEAKFDELFGPIEDDD